MKTYSCEIKGTGVALDVRINEYLLYSSPSANHSYTVNLRPWMRQENGLRVQAKVVTDEEKPNEPVNFSVEVSTMEGDRRDRVAYMDFPKGIAAPSVATMPFDSAGKTFVPGEGLTFTVPDNGDLINKPWEISGPGIHSPQEVWDLFKKIQQAFLDRNVPAIMDLSQARIRFCARLYRMEPREYEQAVRQSIERTIGRNPDWRVINDPARELTVHEFLPHKVMRLLDLRGNFALMTKPDARERQNGYDIIVAMTRDGLFWIM